MELVKVTPKFKIGDLVYRVNTREDSKMQKKIASVFTIHNIYITRNMEGMTIEYASMNGHASYEEKDLFPYNGIIEL